MIVATDVDYGPAGARVAVVGFDSWVDSHTRVEETASCVAGGDYKPGAFFERELPCILPVVQALCARYPVRVVVVDGYVDLGIAGSSDGDGPSDGDCTSDGDGSSDGDGPVRVGLGGHLHAALAAAGRPVVIVGVAKNPFRGALAAEVLRGTSTRPLHISARGVDLAEAARWVTQMHGRFRIPTLLRRVDQLARGYV